jgi:FkbM family methyltransferase
MKPVFIDIGAHFGLEIEWALNHGYEVYAFEPNPIMGQVLTKYQDRAFISYTAAWKEDGFMPLYDGVDAMNEGASLYPEKTTTTRDSIIVQTTDIGRFLRNLDKDIAILKINAEGAEYDILDSIVEHSVIRRIQKIWVEDHEAKIPSVEWREHKQGILKWLRAMGITVIDWVPALLEEQK